MTKEIEIGKAKIYKNGSSYICEADVAKLDNNELVAVFCDTKALRHADFDDILLMRSKDGGRTWDTQNITTVWKSDGYFGGNNPSINRLKDGTLLVFFLINSFDRRKGILEDFGAQSEELAKQRECEGIYFSRSTDNGYTWSPLYKGNTTPMRWGQPADGITELPDGTLLLALTGLHNGPWTWQARDDHWRSFLIRSDDGGLNWEYYSTIGYDPANIISFHEPSLARTKDGVLVCMMRSEHSPRRRHGHFWVSYSYNEGESWTPPQPTNIWGYPADLLLLKDGRMLCTYSYRRDPYGLRGCISNDGIQWDVANEFSIFEGGEDKRRLPNTPWWHIGYPASCQLDDGTVFTIAHEWSEDEVPVQYLVGAHYHV